MNRYTRMVSQVLLVLLLLSGCTSSNSEPSGTEYIQSYIDDQLSFDFDAVMESIDRHRQELDHHAAIALRVNREMDHLLRDPTDHSKLKEYVENLSQEERSAPAAMMRVATEMQEPLTQAFEAFSVQMAVMALTEELCGRQAAAERWQDLFIRVSSGLEGKLPEKARDKVDRRFILQLDATLNHIEEGAYKPSCSAQIENTDFLYFSESLLKEF